jgi:hypothetical protein
VSKLVLSFAAAAAVCVQARADVIDITVPGTTLQQVVGNQFIVNNHLFTLAPNAFTSNLFNPSLIFITPVLNADPLTGAGFRLTGSFQDPPGGGPSTFSLHYTVDMLPPAIAAGLRFDRADLRFNGFADGSGSVAQVAETVSSSAEGALGVITVSNNDGSTPVFENQTVFASNSLTQLTIQDDGQFDSGEEGSSSASFFDFSFGDRAVPTPGTLALLAGALVLTRSRRR